jgi:predicted transcriptional regulator
MRLTGRQEEFIRNLLDLYQQSGEPLHYTELAERLGVNRFTAYDMLRLLEEKGLARSEYRLAKDKEGPGRSEIVFLPTEKAHQLIAKLLVSSGKPLEDWELAKNAILKTIASDGTWKSSLIKEILARAPVERASPVGYCLEVMVIIALRLRQGQGQRLLLQYLPRLLPEGDTGNIEDLNLLGGFTLGILAREYADDPTWSLEMFDHVKRYQTIINAMTPEQRNDLASRLIQIYQSLSQKS